MNEVRTIVVWAAAAVVMLGFAACKKTRSNAERLAETEMQDARATEDSPLGGGQVLPDGESTTTTDTQDASQPGRKVFSADQAVIFYNFEGKDNTILTFDHNGQRMRWDTDYGKNGHMAIIVDEVNRTYTLGTSGTWVDMPYENDLIERVFALFLFHDELYSQVPGYTRLPDETIAEQSCTMISYPVLDHCSQKYGGWHGVLMLNENCGKVSRKATGVRLDVPEKAFTQTMDMFN
ncbi:MAG: hypothetical protein LBP98_01030 [Tannerella sp.]|jgi:hypothetical protein|nr:hypothetical protein [Tannerella sp.]